MNTPAFADASRNQQKQLMSTLKRSLLFIGLLCTIVFIIRAVNSGDEVQSMRIKGPLGRYQDKDTDNLPTDAQANQDEQVTADDGLDSIHNQHGHNQVALVNSKPKSLEDQLAFYYPYNLTRPFPKSIWQTWKNTPQDKDFDDMYRAFVNNWNSLHPNHNHEIVTDSVAAYLIEYLYCNIPEIVRAYKALPLPVLKADFFRYLILFAKGGIYSDIDTYPFRPSVEWIDNSRVEDTYGMVIGIEADPDRPDWAEWYSRRIQFCQWTIQSKAGHPILRNVIAYITRETLKRKRAGKLKVTKKLRQDVVEFTGPALWTDKIFDYFNDPKYFDTSTSKGKVSWEAFTGMTERRQVGDVVILPITSFSPGVAQMGAGEDDDSMAFVKHIFSGMSFYVDLILLDQSTDLIQGNWKPGQ